MQACDNKCSQVKYASTCQYSSLRLYRKKEEILRETIFFGGRCEMDRLHFEICNSGGGRLESSMRTALLGVQCASTARGILRP